MSYDRRASHERGGEHPSDGPGLQLDLATPPETGGAIGFLPQPTEK